MGTPLNENLLLINKLWKNSGSTFAIILSSDPMNGGRLGVDPDLHETTYRGNPEKQNTLQRINIFGQFL